MAGSAQSAQRASSPPTAEPRRSPLAFFLLVFALSVPFALLGEVTKVKLSPGIPVSALAFVCPAAAACILRWRENGSAGAAALLRRALDVPRVASKVWWIPILLLMPVVTLLAYWAARALGVALPTPRFSFPATLVMFVAFVIAALGEELGWSGYAIDPMQARWTALPAALLLGAVWAVWHIIAMVQAGQSAAWIAWGCLDMVATRVLMVWIYNNTGRSVLAVALYHAMANLSTKSMFPGGSYPAERIISAILVLAAGMVVVAWGPRTLARLRPA